MSIAYALRRTWWILLPNALILAAIEFIRPFFDNLLITLLISFASALLFATTLFIGHRRLTGSPTAGGYPGKTLAIIGVTFVLGFLIGVVSFPAGLLFPSFPVFLYFVQSLFVVFLAAVIACMGTRSWLDSITQAYSLIRANQRAFLLCVVATLASMTVVNPTTVTHLPAQATIALAFLSVFMLGFMKVFSIVLFIKLDMEQSQGHHPDEESSENEDSIKTV